MTNNVNNVDCKLANYSQMAISCRLANTSGSAPLVGTQDDWLDELSSVSRQRNSLLERGNYLRVPAEGDKREKNRGECNKEGSKLTQNVVVE
jgi:hypothetical protein